jgi:heme-degrading monooxygenase HmoA
VIVRAFTARPKPGAADELTRLAEEISVPFVDGHAGLVARYFGRGLGATGDELVMISVWESLDAMKGMAGEDWESAVIPDPRMHELIDESSIRHYETRG